MPIEPWFPLAIYYADLENAAEQKDSLVSNVLKLEKESYKNGLTPTLPGLAIFMERDIFIKTRTLLGLLNN